MPETCANSLGLVTSCIYYARQTREIYQVLPCAVNFKAPGELWNPLSKTVLSKCSFICNKGLVNIWNGHKAQSKLYVGPVYIFLFLSTAYGYWNQWLHVLLSRWSMYACFVYLHERNNFTPARLAIIRSETLSMQKCPNKCSSSVPSSGQINEFSYVQSHKITLMYLKLKLL